MLSIFIVEVFQKYFLFFDGINHYDLEIKAQRRNYLKEKKLRKLYLKLLVNFIFGALSREFLYQLEVFSRSQFIGKCQKIFPL